MCLGLATGYIKPEKKCYSGINVPLQKETPPMPVVKEPLINEISKSLLKPYTWFDRIKDMDIDEMAEQLAIIVVNSIYERNPLFDRGLKEYDSAVQIYKERYMRLLKREAESLQLNK